MTKLSDKQYAAIAILSLPKRGGMTYEEVADKVGVHRTTLHEWRRNDDFNKVMKDTIVRNTLDDLPEIMASIPRHIVDTGNAALFRTLLQAHGLLTEKVEVETKTGNVDVESIRERMAEWGRSGNEDN